ncbi:hypothetical protein [Serratia sp. UGAL515B_01]|uniref:hypothetical protein n=1 Tax=Serratia sp. UGAL515B_01 TaxID=2986763 RepID=UPI0029547BF2|nr:hypothetical protein [Serratia sp. UGAL515B_01]WON78205.1 hypothetical protein OK023_05920 [Serratia sp. UGAL515B_01]
MIRISVDIASIAVVMGMLPTLFLSQLPSTVLSVEIVIAIFLLWQQKQHYWCQFLCVLLLGFIFSIGSANILLQQVTVLTNGVIKKSLPPFRA